MRKAALAAFAAMLCLTFMNINSGTAAMSKNHFFAKARIIAEDQEAVIALDDNPVSRDFVSLLPLDVTFEDYAGEEKITTLPRKLATSDGVEDAETKGDFAYYAPWGNLAVFYKGYGMAAGLYILGTIESGKEWLGEAREPFTARIELLGNK